jgi:hypothetical protein
MTKNQGTVPKTKVTFDMLFDIFQAKARYE